MKQQLGVLVVWTLLATFALNRNRPDVFYKVCMCLQTITLIGIMTTSHVAIQMGHVGFAVSLYVGTFTLPNPDVFLVSLLCVTTLVVRRLANGCPFDMVAGGLNVMELGVLCDIFYAIPLFIITWRQFYHTRPLQGEGRKKGRCAPQVR